MASGFVQLLMMNRKFKKMLPMLALGCCAFGLAACGSCDLAEYVPPVLAAPTRKAAFVDGDYTTSFVRIDLPTTIHDVDDYSHSLVEVTDVNIDTTLLPESLLLNNLNFEDGSVYLEFVLDKESVFSGVEWPNIFSDECYILLSFNTDSYFCKYLLNGVTFSDFYSEIWEYEYTYVEAGDTGFYTFVGSFTNVDAPSDIAGGVVEILTGGITGLGQGIASGVNTFINSLAFFNGALSPYFVLTIVFGGIALAVGLTRLVFNWVSNLGGSK